MPLVQVGIIIFSLLLSAMRGGAGRTVANLELSESGSVAEATVVPLTRTEQNLSSAGVPSSLDKELENEAASGEAAKMEALPLLEAWPEDELSSNRFKVEYNPLNDQFSLSDNTTGNMLLTAVMKSFRISCINQGNKHRFDTCLATLSSNYRRNSFKLVGSKDEELSRLKFLRSWGGPRKLQVTLMDGHSETKYTSKKPKWVVTKQGQGYVLDFCDRVKLASRKNFMLISDGNDKPSESCNDAFMIFGKTAQDKFLKHEFLLDLKKPVSLVQAFGLAIASILY